MEYFFLTVKELFLQYSVQDNCLLEESTLWTKEYSQASIGQDQC